MTSSKMVKLFEINDKTYAYDAIHSVLSDVSDVSIDDFKDTFDKSTSFLNDGRWRITPEDENLEEFVLFQLNNYLPRKFAIEVTEACTLRCKYCYFTAENANRPHSNYTISQSDARKAIDLYYDIYTKAFSQIHDNHKNFILNVAPPNLTWWGGEPLLAFNAIKDTASYFKSKDWKKYGIGVENLTFGIITNFTIFNEDIERFLIENEVYTFISLDGDQISHDRNRVFVNGEGSFEIVTNHIDRLLDKYPDFCKKHVYIQAVMAENTDKDKTRSFLAGKFKLFSREQKIRSCSFYPQNNIGEFLPKYNISGISAEISMSKYYSELKRMSDLPETELIELILNNDDIKQKFKDIFTIERSIGFEYETASDSHIMTFTCPIGIDNFFVSARGKLFACNKCDYQMPIGDIHTGFNVNSLIELYEKYYSKIRPKCSSCWAYKQCYICPAKVMCDNDFVLPTDSECDKIKKAISATFIYYIILNEFEDLYEIIKNTIEESENNMLNFPKPININNYKNENN